MKIGNEAMDSFIEWFNKIHKLDAAYSDKERDQGAHKRSAKAFFENSRPFLERLPLDDISSVLDVGMGYGYHCDWFSSKSLETMGISVHTSDQEKMKAEEMGYEVKQMDMQFLDFENDRFDLVWSHHSLEHSFSPVYALREWLRVIKPGGYLAVTVPPHKKQIVSGHFNVGWSVGQLIYLLGITGYELQDGLFMEQGYNVRALVRKPLEEPDFEGLCWLFKLKNRLPVKLQENVLEAPASLGKCYFEGDIEELSPDCFRLKSTSK